MNDVSNLVRNSKKKVLTLAFVHDDKRVLLGMKKRGFGAGRWNGFGGKVMPEETIEQAAAREFQEETGMRAKSLTLWGHLTFIFEGDPVELDVHVFSAIGEGNPIETEEMAPQWFAHSDIPLDAMWPDDRYWLPLLLAGKSFEGRFVFADHNTITEYFVTERTA